MKKYISIFLAVMFLFTFTGCSEKNYEPSNVDYITIMHVKPDPVYYEVFTVSPDGGVKLYDFTLYCMQNPFDYFTDPMPPESEYELSEWQIAENDWNSLIKVLEENRFFGLPDEIKPANGFDYSTYYIEVGSNGDVHRSGGYGAGHGQDRTNKRFMNIRDEIFACLEAGRQNVNN